MKEAVEFVIWMLRPRAIRWWWRLGSFECICYSIDWMQMESAVYRERLKSMDLT